MLIFSLVPEARTIAPNSELLAEFQEKNTNAHISYVYVQHIALVKPLGRVFPCLRGSAPVVPFDSVDYSVLLKQHDKHETLLKYVIIVRGVLLVVYCLLLISACASEHGLAARDGSTLFQRVLTFLHCLPQMFNFCCSPTVRSTKPYRIPNLAHGESLELELLKYALKVQQEEAFGRKGQQYCHMARWTTLNHVELSSESVEWSDFHIFSVYPAPPAWAAKADNDDEQPELYPESLHTGELDSVSDVESKTAPPSNTAAPVGRNRIRGDHTTRGEPNSRSFSGQVPAATARDIPMQRQAHDTCQCVMYGDRVFYQMAESDGWSLAAVHKRILSPSEGRPAEFILVYKPTTTTTHMNTQSASATSSTAVPVLRTVALNSWHVEQSLRDLKIVVARQARWCYLLIVLIALTAIVSFTDFMPSFFTSVLLNLIGSLSLLGTFVVATQGIAM